MSNKEQYRKVCEQHPGMLVFAQAWWLDVVCNNWDAVIAMKGEHVKGAWAYPIEQKMGVKLLRTPKLTPYLGPQVFYPADVKGSNKDGYEHDTVSELLKQLPEVQVWNLAVQPGLKQAGLFKNYGLSLQAQQTFLLSLAADEATLLANLKDTNRRNIKQAEKEYTIVNSPGHIGELFEFHKHTLGRKQKGIAHDLSDLQQLLKATTDNQAGALWVAMAGDKVEGIGWYVWDKECCYFIMGAMNPEADGYKAMALLHWHAIKEAKRNGVAYFDFEGSMDAGVERFFRSFGGQRELYLYLQKNESILWKAKQTLLG